MNRASKGTVGTIISGDRVVDAVSLFPEGHSPGRSTLLSTTVGGSVVEATAPGTEQKPVHLPSALFEPVGAPSSFPSPASHEATKSNPAEPSESFLGSIATRITGFQTYAQRKIEFATNALDGARHNKIHVRRAVTGLGIVSIAAVVGIGYASRRKR